MRVISTLSAPRTGSTFFQEHIASVDGYSYNAMEFFNEWNPSHFYHLKNIYFKYKEPFPESYQKYLNNIFNTLKTHSLKSSEYPYLSRSPCYNFEMLPDTINALKNHDYEYFFHKIVETSWLKESLTEKMTKTIELSDKLIINYRKSILDVFISRKRACRSEIWVNRTNSNYVEYQKEFLWNKKEFINAADIYIKFYKDILQIVNEQKKEHALINYETLVQSNEEDRLNIIRNVIGAMEYPLQEPRVRKQSTTKKQVDSFSNKEEFLSDYNDIDEYYKVLDLNVDTIPKSTFDKQTIQPSVFTFKSKVITRKPVKNKLAVITSFFNPCDYKRTRKNFIKFFKNISDYADLFPIELSFNNDFFIDNKNCIQIKGNERNILWQKETLLNIVLQNLPKEYTDVAWIDSDIIFENSLWTKKLVDSLNKYKVVQLFGNAHGVFEDNEPSIIKSLYNLGEASELDLIGKIGLAWAARREVLDKLKFLDNQILGSADMVMSYSFINRNVPNSRRSDCNYNEETQKWCEEAKKEIDCSISYIDTNITHLYHGSKVNRKYKQRYKDLGKINDKDISKNTDGIWQIDNDDMLDRIKKYFLSRDEDQIFS